MPGRAGQLRLGRPGRGRHPGPGRAGLLGRGGDADGHLAERRRHDDGQDDDGRQRLLQLRQPAAGREHGRRGCGRADFAIAVATPAGYAPTLTDRRRRCARLRPRGVTRDDDRGSTKPDFDYDFGFAPGADRRPHLAGRERQRGAGCGRGRHRQREGDGDQGCGKLHDLHRRQRRLRLQQPGPEATGR